MCNTIVKTRANISQLSTNPTKEGERGGREGGGREGGGRKSKREMNEIQ